jgi:hypothetical protein
MVFASCQFIVIEWQVYSIPKTLPLGLIGLMEVIPAVSMALFAGHCRPKGKKGLLLKCILAFRLLVSDFFSIDLPAVVQRTVHP